MSQISDFPDELWLDVFSFLDARSLCNVAKVCVRLYELSEDDALWYDLCCKNIGAASVVSYDQRGWKAVYIQLITKGLSARFYGDVNNHRVGGWSENRYFLDTLWGQVYCIGKNGYSFSPSDTFQESRHENANWLLRLNCFVCGYSAPPPSPYPTPISVDPPSPPPPPTTTTTTTEAVSSSSSSSSSFADQESKSKSPPSLSAGKRSLIKAIIRGNCKKGGQDADSLISTNSAPYRKVVDMIVNARPVSLTVSQDEKNLSFVDTIVICFSLISEASFLEVKQLATDMNNKYPEVPFILVGTHLDLCLARSDLEKLQRQRLNPVKHKTAQELADRIGAFAYIECSSTTGLNVVESFVWACLATKKFGAPPQNDNPPVLRNEGGFMPRRRFSRIHSRKKCSIM